MYVCVCVCILAFIIRGTNFFEDKKLLTIRARLRLVDRVEVRIKPSGYECMSMSSCQVRKTCVCMYVF